MTTALRIKGQRHKGKRSGTSIELRCLKVKGTQTDLATILTSTRIIMSPTRPKKCRDWNMWNLIISINKRVWRWALLTLNLNSLDEMTTKILHHWVEFNKTTLGWMRSICSITSTRSLATFSTTLVGSCSGRGTRSLTLDHRRGALVETD